MAFGASGTTQGEVVFNTSMTGYKEILTDPSYKGQIVTMTYPLIGNYGINREDTESRGPHVVGFVVKELSPVHSNWRADESLDDVGANEAGPAGDEESSHVSFSRDSRRERPARRRRLSRPCGKPRV